MNSSMRNVWYCFGCLLSCLLFTLISFGQQRSPLKESVSPKELVISYNILVSGRKIDGIAETYNGGVKTVFVKDHLVRLRLVSLMRTQSIFFNNTPSVQRVAAVVKESGARKTKFYLTPKTWKIYNEKYDSVQCEFTEDTLTILNKLCKKATVRIKDGRSVTVYYYPGKQNTALAAAEPLFSCIPGLVMKYIYEAGEKSIEYTAVKISTKKLDASVFTVPVKGYTLQRYRPGKPNVNVKDLSNDDDEEIIDDENE